MTENPDPHGRHEGPDLRPPITLTYEGEPGNEIDPDFKQKVLDAYYDADNLLSLTHPKEVMPDINDETALGRIDWRRAETLATMYKNGLGVDVQIVFGPANRDLDYWETGYGNAAREQAADSRLVANPAKQLNPTAPLQINDRVRQAWNEVQGDGPRTWGVWLVPTLNHPPIQDINHDGTTPSHGGRNSQMESWENQMEYSLRHSRIATPHPQTPLDAYLNMQLLATFVGGEPVDDGTGTSSWVGEAFSAALGEELLAATGSWEGDHVTLAVSRAQATERSRPVGARTAVLLSN